MILYNLIPVNEIPNSRRGRKNAPWVNQLRKFMASGIKQAKLDGLPDNMRKKAYGGLSQASRRAEFKNMIDVIKDREDIYLIRRG